MITLTADSRRATATSDEPITAGSVGIPVTVMLSAEFDGLQAVVTFRAGPAAADVAYDGQRMSVPSQCLTQAGRRLTAGVYGARPDGTVVIPTVWCDIGIIQEGTRPSGIYPADPAPSWAAQVQKWAREARDAVAGALSSRVSSLDATAIVAQGGYVEVVGIPAYVTDVSGYAAYGITDTGWYAFAKVVGPDGARVGAGTTVTGADGHIAIPGEDHVDVAVRFDVAAQSKVVTIAWGEATDTLVFRASDLAVRNLDYRTTFYVYDLAPYATWEWAVTTDGTFASGRDYWHLVDGEYEVVDVTEYTAGDPLPAWYEQVVTYALTEDATFAEGKTYYTLVEGDYVAATVTAGEDVPEDTYYEQVVTYTLTEDETYLVGKAYYRRSGITYSEAVVVAGTSVPELLYVHSKLTIEGMVKNVTYRLDQPVDCPSEFVLPEVDDDEHGCWFEMRFRHTGAYSSTLTPPSPDVKVAAQHTQAESKGLNMVDLHYSNVAGAKVWRFLNTHSDFAEESETLVSIAFRTPPDKVAYVAGEALDTTGAVVVATYEDGHTAIVTPTFAPANGATLTAEDTELTATLTVDEVTATASTPITVTGGE